MPAAPVATLTPDAPRVRSHRSVVSFLAFLAMVMAVGVDIALPAFGTIDRQFGVTDGGGSISLVISAYFFGMALGQLVFGPAADRFGRRACLVAGIVLTMVGALGSAVAPSFGLLLAARLVWGIGAASPGVLRTTIARDLFDGEEMARVVSVVMAVFLIGPIIVPSIGQGILAVASWRWVFGAATIVSVIGLVWSVRFGETLRPEHRRPLDARTFLAGARTVVTHRATMGFILAQTFATGAFQIFLGSGQPIIERIYDRGSQFALLFGVCGVFIAAALLGSNRLLGRFGTRTMVQRISLVFAGLAVVGLGMFVAFDGRPPFLAWFGWLAVTNATVVMMSPMCNALALEPMGALAGTASAVLGAITLAGGATLASVFDALIEDSVTPMGVGYVVYSALAVVCVRFAGRRLDEAAPPIQVHVPLAEL